MEDKKVNWEYFELSVDVPGMDHISSIIQNSQEFIIETYGYKQDRAIIIFNTASIVTFRKMKTQDTYNFKNDDGSYAGLISVSDNSHFLEWYKSVDLFGYIKDPKFRETWKCRSYALHTDSDVMEVISLAPPKVFYCGSNIAVEKEEKDK
jgi:hypothetical protein